MFKMSGLEDILIEPGSVAANSITGVLSGNMYNSSIGAHKLLFESLGRMRISHFLETVDEPTKSKYEHIIQQRVNMSTLSTYALLPSPLMTICSLTYFYSMKSLAKNRARPNQTTNLRAQIRNL